MKRFLVALQFLTIIPVKINSIVDEEDFGKSLKYFPIIGIFIGIAEVFIMLSLSSLPAHITAVLMVIITCVMTGALHIDGLADTFDALYVSQDKEKALEVMREPHTGAIGAASIILDLLLKFALMLTVINFGMWQAPILMASFGRWSQVLTCFSQKYARDEGVAKYFIERADKKEILLASIFTLFIFTVLSGLSGIIAFFIVSMPLYCWIIWIRNKFEGITGDIIGATSEIAEILIFFPLFIMGRPA